MQIQIPHIEPFEDATEVLALVSNSKKYTERLKILNAVEETIVKSLDRYKDIVDIEATKTQASALLNDARGVKTEADKYAERIKADADKQAQGILEKAQNKIAESVAREAAVTERESKAGAKETAQATQEKALIQREAQAVADLERAAAVARQAQALQDRLTAKLGQLHSIAVE
jgi:hypothetical protein